MPVGFKKKKNQLKSPSPESRVPKTDSDPPIRSDRESGRDTRDSETAWILELLRQLSLKYGTAFLSQVNCFEIS